MAYDASVKSVMIPTSSRVPRCKKMSEMFPTQPVARYSYLNPSRCIKLSSQVIACYEECGEQKYLTHCNHIHRTSLVILCNSLRAKEPSFLDQGERDTHARLWCMYGPLQHTSGIQGCAQGESWLQLVHGMLLKSSQCLNRHL